MDNPNKETAMDEQEEESLTLPPEPESESEPVGATSTSLASPRKGSSSAFSSPQRSSNAVVDNDTTTSSSQPTWNSFMIASPQQTFFSRTSTTSDAATTTTTTTPTTTAEEETTTLRAPLWWDNNNNNNNNNEWEPDDTVATVEGDEAIVVGDGFGEVWKMGHHHHHQHHQQQQQQQQQHQSMSVQRDAPTISNEKQTKSQHQIAAIPRAPMMDAETPLVSNHKNTVVHKNLEDVLTSTLSRHQIKMPTAETVSTSVSTTVNQALDRLLHFATPYVARVSTTLTDSGIPGVLNTSTESSPGTDDDDDDDYDDGDQRSAVSSALTSSEISDGFDIKELEAELRSNSTRSVTQNETSDDAVRDKPPHQKQQQQPPSSPPPPNVVTPGPVARDTSPTPSLPRNSSNNNNNPPAVSDGRAMTPIMRMRHPATRKETTLHDDETTATTTTASRRMRKTRSEEDYMATKQKRWKEKMKLMGRRREKERTMLDGQQPLHRRRRGATAAAGVDTFPSCQSEVTKVLERFVRSRCGNMEDVMFEEEEEEEEESVGRFSLDESEYDESDDDETATDSEGGSSLEQETRGTTSHTTTVAPVVEKPNSRIKTNNSSKAKSSRQQQQQQQQPQKQSPTASSKLKASPMPKPEINNERTADEPGVNDKTFIKSFIWQVTKKGMEVMLHKQNRGKSFSGPPFKVNSSIKPGTKNHHREFGSPKFVWEPLDGNNDATGEIDLFDIASLDKATVHQLGDYPLAMPGRSIFIRLKRGAEYVFEALSDDDALRFIHGMRWVIARLAFNLIIGNLGVSCELLEVERSGDPDSEAGRFPQTLKQEANWTKAMNDVTCHLVDQASLR